VWCPKQNKIKKIHLLDCTYKARYNGGTRWPRGQLARRVIAEAKQRSQWSVIGWVTKIYYLELRRASEGTLSRWSGCIVSTHSQWVRVVGYGPFSLCVIHKEGLCPSSWDINRLMMMMMIWGPMIWMPRGYKVL
jgi:hypothetical protein